MPLSPQEKAKVVDKLPGRAFIKDPVDKLYDHLSIHMRQGLNDAINYYIKNHGLTGQKLQVVKDRLSSLNPAMKQHLLSVKKIAQRLYHDQHENPKHFLNDVAALSKQVYDNANLLGHNVIRSMLGLPSGGYGREDSSGGMEKTV